MSENKNPNPYRRAKAIAVSVLLLGLAASVAGNIQSILLEVPKGEAPSVGSMISAVWWPGILFLMIEIAIHTPWAKTGTDRVTQWAGAGVIGALAFYISYFHLAHVLSSFGYDVVSRYLGPLAVDTAMMVATMALNRIGHAMAAAALARELATEDMAKAAELATLATGMAKELASAGQEELATEPVATPEPVATAGQEPSLADDWADLEGDLDRELAEMTATAQAAPEPAAAAEPEPAQEPASDRAPVALTTVPAEAAKRIQEILAEDPSATGVAIAQALMDAGLAASSKTGRRYAAAVKNNTARVA